MKFIFNPLSKADLNQVYDWFQEPKININYAEEVFWSVEAVQNKYLPRILAQEQISSFIIKLENKAIGFIQYYALNDFLPQGIREDSELFEQYPRSQCAGIDLFLSERAHGRANLSVEILDQFIRVEASAFDLWLLDPKISNHRARYCFTKAGFQHSAFSKDPNHMLMLKTKINRSLHLDLLVNHPGTIPNLANIWLKTLGQAWLPQIKLEQVIKKFKTHLNQNQLPLSMVAFDDEIPIACAALRITDGIRSELTPWLASLVVDPAYQKRKIAHLLIDAIKLKARYLGFTKLYLLCFDPGLPEYYARFDFEIFDTAQLLGLPAKLMYCTL